AAGVAPLYHYYVGRLVDMYAVEVDYDVRPTTAVIGRDYLGRLRLLRGFTGWAVYSVKEGLGSAVLDRLLAIASELGVGKLRAMGMGEVRAEVIRPGAQPATRQQF
ncbi:CRISPR system precrRNA processing endoribonuclease RAMP protein Cas6, partial [Acidilobus sp.]|uniref:CRISPR system precrRNA processing endoribonuclease RAMP protein Cas6 n=1 Tax=Acidilobus sp. TaxID=1872109 RepID=UPI003CFFADB5